MDYVGDGRDLVEGFVVWSIFKNQRHSVTL